MKRKVKFSKTYCFRVSETQHKLIMAYSERKGIPESYVIREALNRMLRNEYRFMKDAAISEVHA